MRRLRSKRIHVFSIKPLRRLTKLRVSMPSAGVLWIAAIGMFVMWAFISINPFQPANPFLREVTIGQDIMGDWRYGGIDPASGYLRFYSAYQSIAIPGNSTTFAADGEFITIDGHTPSTITFEPAYESQTMGPTIVVAILLAITAVVVALRRRRPRRGIKRPLRVSAFNKTQRRQ